MKQLGAGAVSIDRDKTQEGVGDLICVFVEGTRDQLLSVLEDVQNESHIQGARLTNTISPAQLTQYSNGAFVPASQQANHQSPRQVASLPASTVDKIVSQREMLKKWDLRAPVRKTIDDVASSEGASMSGGMGGVGVPKADVPAEKSKSKGRLTATSPHALARRTYGGEHSGPTRDTRRAEVASNYSYQVFFVLDDAKSPSASSVARPSQRAPVVAQRPQHQLRPVAASPASTQPLPTRPAAHPPSATKPAE